MLTQANPLQQRVDTLLYEHMADDKQLAKVWSVIKLLLLMSHGQATVERGFSVNKEVAVENLTERSFIAQRIIHDHIESVGCLANVKISKQLLTSSARARQKYLSYLDDQKRSSLPGKCVEKKVNNGGD